VIKDWEIDDLDNVDSESWKPTTLNTKTLVGSRGKWIKGIIYREVRSRGMGQ
jgi:hypothetical protein